MGRIYVYMVYVIKQNTHVPMHVFSKVEICNPRFSKNIECKRILLLFVLFRKVHYLCLLVSCLCFLVCQQSFSCL